MKLLCYFMFTLSPMVATGLVFLFYVRTLSLGWRWKLAITLALAAASAKTGWFALFGGNRYYPDFRSLALVDALGITYVFVLLFAALACVPPWHGKIRAWALPVVAAVLTAWGSYAALRVPDVRHLDVPVAGLPAGFAGLTVAHVSDIHCSPSARRSFVAEIVARVNACHPDLVCLTGDLVDGSPEERAADLAPLADLRARLGVLGCTGNHEYYSGYGRWRPLYAAWGIRMLDNAHVAFTNGTDVLVVGGVTDYVAPRHARKAKKGTPQALFARPDAAAAFSNAPPSSCRILLQHQPKDLPRNDRLGVRLQLSGHTHGAPIVGTGPLIGLMNEGHVRGFYREGDLTLYLTPGAGQWVGFPARIGVPSEIAILHLVPAKRE